MAVRDLELILFFFFSWLISEDDDIAEAKDLINVLRYDLLV